MKIIQMAPNVYVNIGTGAVSRIELHTSGGIPVVYLNDGSAFNFPLETMTSLVDALKSQEQNYERN